MTDLQKRVEQARQKARIWARDVDDMEWCDRLIALERAEAAWELVKTCQTVTALEAACKAIEDAVAGELR